MPTQLYVLSSYYFLRIRIITATQKKSQKMKVARDGRKANKRD